MPNALAKEIGENLEPSRSTERMEDRFPPRGGVLRTFEK